MEKNNETVFGINSIRPLVGNHSEATILKWKREYPSFPIRKLRGVWVANKEAIVEWFRKFCMGEVEPSEDGKGSKAFKTRKNRAKRSKSQKIT